MKDIGHELSGAVAQQVASAFRRIFDDAEEARVLVGADRQIMFVNKAGEAMFGRPRTELVGRSTGVLSPARFDEEYNGAHVRLMEAAGTRSVQLNMWGHRVDGEEFPARVVARVLDVGEGQRLMSLVIIDQSDREGPGRQLRDFLDSAPEGSLLVDERGKIVMANARAQEIFQRSGPDLVGHAIEDLIPQAARSRHEQLREGFTGEAGPHAMGQGVRVVALRADGSTFPVSVVLSSLGTSEGVLVSAAVTDLTAFELLLGEADQLKDRFLSTVSHELRTPLTSILAGVELLEDAIDRVEDPALHGHLAHLAGVIGRGAQRERALVEDLLVMTSIDQQVIGTYGARTDIVTVVKDVVGAWRARAEACGVRLSTDAGAETLFVSGSELWLGRCLDYLVSNAVKFTPADGHVVVRVGSADGLAWVDVSDTGPGIPDAEAETVFNRLYRGSSAIASEVQGTGLGLAIARSIAESHGGTLTLEQHTSGCVFRLTTRARAR